MEHNEISMQLFVKMDIHDKRNEAHKFKVWTKCQVKIEAIKCLPCFLRLTFTPMEPDVQLEHERQHSFTVSVNVPGVTISLATSRTKQFSYGLFWTHNRRDCFIYFALESEASCRKHMKWIKRSIKNLELYRQVFLEQRRNSRSMANDVGPSKCALGPLPKIPDNFDFNASSWSQRVSRASAIYEEIFESSRVSRRVSRASIASGIYEEMKPTAQFPAQNEKSCNVITEEAAGISADTVDMEPPPVPPLPRKRINTYANEAGLLGEIPRSSTNPESEMAKKKKYKVMLDNLFGGRSKRAESVSEAPATTVEDLIDEPKPLPIYSNDIVACKRYRQQQQRKINELQQQAKRNSFSSPDLSKINLLDTFDEECVADILQNSFDTSGELDLTLDESSIAAQAQQAAAAVAQFKVPQLGSVDSLNISEQIPTNFNFSACCNSSTINLVGSNGAVLQQATQNKHKILIDDLTGYCVMAPIVKKTTGSVATSTESTSSGYSTGSYSSTTSTCTNSAEDAVVIPASQPAIVTPTVATKVVIEEPTLLDSQPRPADESAIYENMCGASANTTTENSATAVHNFSEHLYENLLTIKAAQELEAVSTLNTMSTSTPTDSPQPFDNFHATPPTTAAVEEEESYYQTPRKSIISVDDKIPSYYPNSCDSVKLRRRSQSPNNSGGSPTSGLKHLVSVKMQRERKENLYIASPQSAREKPPKPPKTKKTAAHKVSENVYAVRHINKRSAVPSSAHNNNNNNAKQTNANATPPTTSSVQLSDALHAELLQLAMLQNIDFKFDDTKSLQQQQQHHTPKTSSKEHPSNDYENCYQAAESATRLLHKYATLAKYGGKSSEGPTSSTTPRPASVTPQRTTPAVLQHHLQDNQSGNMKYLSPSAAAINIGGMSQSQSAATKSPASSTTAPSGGNSELQGLKKFASLPRFKRIDFSPLKLRINNVLQRHQHQ